MFEYTATPGLIDVAYVHPDSNRLDFTDQGIKDNDAPADEETPPLFQVRPDLEIELTGKPMPADRIMLDQFAKPVAADVWKITLDKILRAIEEDQTIDEFYAFLALKADRGLPVEVEWPFDDAKNRSAAMEEIGSARLIRCRPQALAEMIGTDPLTQ